MIRGVVAALAMTVLVATTATAQIGIVEPIQPARPAPKPRPPARAPRAAKPAEPPRAAMPLPVDAASARLPISVTTSLDRTAVWLGDPIDYTIEIVCPPGTDILAADISRDRLKLDRLDVSSAIQQRETRGDGAIVYRARFRLVSFATDGATAGIEPQAVRYYVHTAGQPPETLVPADEVPLPAKRIAVRSVLPEGDVEWIRDTRTRGAVPAAVKYLTPLGLAAVALALVPLVSGGMGVIRRWEPRRTGRSRRRVLQLQRRALDDIRALEASGRAERRDVLDRLNSLIRDRLADLSIPARNLTADEIAVSIAERGSKWPGGDVVAVLRACESAIYGRSDDMPGTEAVQAAFDEADRLLGARAR